MYFIRQISSAWQYTQYTFDMKLKHFFQFVPSLCCLKHASHFCKTFPFTMVFSFAKSVKSKGTVSDLYNCFYATIVVQQTLTSFFSILWSRSLNSFQKLFRNTFIINSIDYNVCKWFLSHWKMWFISLFSLLIFTAIPFWLWGPFEHHCLLQHLTPVSYWKFQVSSSRW